MNNLTAHMIVRNEAQWIESAIFSVLPYVSLLMIYDTGSTDKTVEIINDLRTEKIVFSKKSICSKKDLIDLRNEMIEKTTSKWFMIADGDEVYPGNIFVKVESLIRNENLYGIYLKNYMCVGDIYHKMPESYGKYEICNHKGHLNLRFYRKIKNWKWYGIYPMEFYGNENGCPLNQMCEKLKFIDDFYWHMSFLKEDRIKYYLGEKIESHIPKAFRAKNLTKRSIHYIARSLIETPMRNIKQRFFTIRNKGGHLE